MVSSGHGRTALVNERNADVVYAGVHPSDVEYMSSRSLVIAGLLLGGAVSLASCGGDAAPPAPPDNPVPVLVSVSPTPLFAGFVPATLTVTGSGFTLGTRVLLNGTPSATTFVNDGALSAIVPAADLAASGALAIVVSTPPPGGGQSQSVSVPIVYPVPKVGSVSPDSTPAGRNFSLPPLLVTLTGTDFTPQSSMFWDGLTELYRYDVSGTSITGVVPADLLAFGGTHKLSVRNASPGGGTSASIDFQVVNPVPVILTLQPLTAATGSAFSLLVVGTGFTRSSVVRWNGANRPTTFDVGNLIASIPAGDVAAPGAASITVFNGAPGGGLSAPFTLPIQKGSLLLAP
jgi:hypothetical protein